MLERKQKWCGRERLKGAGSRMGAIKLPENRCEFCGKEATLLCDKVRGSWRSFGHPPTKKAYLIAGIEGVYMPASGIHTCDALMCEKCATNITGMDLCPGCLKEIKQFLGERRGRKC